MALERDPSVVIIDHISLGVSDLSRSIAFYDACLGELSLSRKYGDDTSAAYARAGVDDFSIHVDAKLSPPSGKAHFAFLASDRISVDRFYLMALANGGSADGEPGLRPRYHANYYAAFVLDPDGNRIEAVCHGAP